MVGGAIIAELSVSNAVDRACLTAEVDDIDGDDWKPFARMVVGLCTHRVTALCTATALPRDSADKAKQEQMSLGILSAVNVKPPHASI